MSETLQLALETTAVPEAGAPRRGGAEQAQGLVWTAHPIVDVLAPPLPVEEIRRWLARKGGFDAVMEYWTNHEAMIREAEEDPLYHGFELGFWQDVRRFLAQRDWVYLLGGNGPGKTEIGGKLVPEWLCANSGTKVLCVATNDGASKQLQQPAVYKYLPPAARNMNERMGPRKREIVKKINYSQAGGFTDGTFVLPTKSQCWFKTVEQYQRDTNSFEGPEYDIAWIDEPSPPALDDTLAYRVGKRRGKFLKTFTAVSGFDAACSKVLTGARLLKSLPMDFMWKITGRNEPAAGSRDNRIIVPELDMAALQVKGCPPGHMPYIMQPLDPHGVVIFMWTQWNPFLPRSADNPAVPSLFDKCKGKSRVTVRIRLFGWAEKLTGCQFPQFNTNVHVVEHAKVMEMLKDKKLTVYHADDPAMARSHFMLWAGVDAQGRAFVFDESPRLEEGEWVADDGEKGDGARVYAGRGVNFYKQYIRARETEHGQAAIRRKGDPRAFATEAAAAEGGKSLFELFAEPDPADPENAVTAPLPFEPAKVRARISFEVEVLNNLLAFDENKPISVENEPRLYINDRCQNLIRALLNWDPAQGETSPWKDPIDCLRYLFDEELVYVDPNVPDIVGGRGW